MIRKARAEDSLILYGLLFLSCLNIGEMGSLIFILFCVFALFKLRFLIPIDKNNYLLATCLCLICTVLSFFTWGINDAIKCLNYLGAYVVGYSLFVYAEDKQKIIRYSLFSVFCGFALQIIMVYFYNLYRGQPSTRTMYAIWNDGLISVTLIALLSSIVIGYSFYAIVINKNKILKYFAIGALLITALINITTATRTPFLLFGIVFFILFLFQTRNGDRSAKIKILLSVVLFALFACAAYYFDWFGVRTFLLNSALFDRFGEEGLQTGRIRIAKRFISCMPKYPFGGGLARKEIHNYAHNILLEIYDMYGIVPFLIISVFYIQGIKNIFKVFKYGNDSDCNYLFVGLYIAILIQMFLEPVIEGFPILFYVFLFMHGMCKAYIKFGLIGELVHEDSGDKYL